MSSSDPSSVQPASRGSSPAGGGGSNGGSGSSSGGAPSTSSSAPEPAQVSLPGMVHLSQVSPPSSFNFQAADQWDRWLRRFNRYRQASGLHTQPESVQVNSLLYTMGEQADDLLDSFHLPEDDVSKFTTVTERFTAHFGKKRNYVYERACFHQRTQQPTESLDAFVNDLYRLADRCNFKAMHDEMLRDRLIAGLADARLSERLQMDSDMTLEKALAHARQSAAIKEQQTTVRAAADQSLFAVRQDQGRLRSSRDRPPLRDAPSSSRHSTPSSDSCPWCGYESHPRARCPASRVTCKGCGKTGHFQRVCRSSPPSGSSGSSARQGTHQSPRGTGVHSLSSHSDSSSSAVSSADAFLGTLTHGTGWNLPMLLHGKAITMKVDTGADVTAIPATVFTSLDLPMSLAPSNRTLRGPDNTSLNVCGRFTADLRTAHSSQSHSVPTQVYVVRDLKLPLLGRPAIEALGILPAPANVLETTSTSGDSASDSRSPVAAEFPDLFSGLGTFGPLHTIQLRDEAPPYSLSTPRRVALPMESKVIEALRRMEAAGVIRPVSEPTDWCAGMVVVPKPNGSVRICGDFTRLNKAVKRERHILPTTDHLLARLGDAKVFSKLDANSGFHQIPLAPESQLLTTFITPIGRFCYTRLPFGISSAPEYFQKQMSDLLSDLPGNICMMDDVLTFGSTLEEEVDNLRPALARLQSAGVTLNSEKCQFHATSIKFLGHVIDGCGIRPDPDKIHAIQELSPCSDVHSVRRLLGMANHLGKFIPDLASITQPLRSLLVKGTPWQWGAEQCAAFDRIKTSLSNEPVLAKYSPNYHTTVSADASSFGLGAVLLQRQPDASVRPVAYLSRSLTPAETRYSQIEKEALAATWACDRLSHYLLGMPFTIETDHKPLIPLLGTRALDDLPPRVLRFRLRLLRFDYSIIHTPGKQLAIADALSRAPLRSTDADATATLEAETAAMVSYVTEALPATAQRLEEVSAWQSDDDSCAHIIEYLQHGWPAPSDAPPVVQFLIEHSAHFSLTDDGLILYDQRLYIPPAHQQEILARLHQGHQGITKCRRLARTSVWWPSLSSDIATLVQTCEECSRHRSQPPEPLLSTPLPEFPWQHLAADFFTIDGRNHLLVIDYYSRFIEVLDMPSLSTARTVSHFKSLFARHGIPDSLTTDNGPQFTSAEFAQFASTYGFRHVTSSPLYPQANGMAERAVRTVKSLFRQGTDWHLALLAYRNTPLENGKSPAQLLMNRQLQSLLPLSPTQRQSHPVDQSDLRAADQRLKDRQSTNHASRHAARTLPSLCPQQPVYLPDREESGHVMSQPALRSYIVATPSGQFRRNRRHIVPMPTPQQLPPAGHSAATTDPDPPASQPSTPPCPAVPNLPSTPPAQDQPDKYVTARGRVVHAPDRF
ncbi:uncharacterized protein K02A2.6-like [Sycon ciliatum]|uniref:uncharacterized protein K02A2.6-like n=1 Tax=Sycon ciliatum TaxID=27933 RepID=UPI0031F68A26